MKRVKSPKADRRKPYAFTPEEVRRLLNAANCARDRAIIVCLLDTGCRSITSKYIMHPLEWLFRQHGAPMHLRSDNGPEFVAHAVRRWLPQQHCDRIYITPGSPWENPYIESFFDRPR